MFTKHDLVASMAKECDICIHLYGKLAAAAPEYRPAAEQRSTLDLLRYLTYCGIAGSRAIATGDWKIFATYQTVAAGEPFEMFPIAMQRQAGEIREFIGQLTDEDLAKPVVMPGQVTSTLGVGLVNGPLKWLTAYKMQLFLYAKASGTEGIGTANAWAGIDWRR